MSGNIREVCRLPDLFLYAIHRYVGERYRATMLTLPTDDEGNTSTRPLGLLVARGTLLVLISPIDGSEEIANPFVQGDDDE